MLSSSSSLGDLEREVWGKGVFKYLLPPEWVAVGSISKRYLEVFQCFITDSNYSEYGAKLSFVRAEVLRQALLLYATQYAVPVSLFAILKKANTQISDPTNPEFMGKLRSALYSGRVLFTKLVCDFGVDTRKVLPEILNSEQSFNPICVKSILCSPFVNLSLLYSNGLPIHILFLIFGKLEYISVLDDIPTVDFNWSDVNGRGAAFWAAVSSNDTTLPLLKHLHTKLKVDMTQCDKYGNCAAMIAVRHRKLECLQYLIDECGTDINTLNRDGRTFAHEACERGFDDILRYLIDRKIDINARTREGDNAYQTAVIYSQSNCVKLFRDRNLIAKSNPIKEEPSEHKQ